MSLKNNSKMFISTNGEYPNISPKGCFNYAPNIDLPPIITSPKDKLKQCLKDVQHNLLFNLNPKAKILKSNSNYSSLLDFSVPDCNSVIKKVYNLKNGKIIGFEEDIINDNITIHNKHASSELSKINFETLFSDAIDSTYDSLLTNYNLPDIHETDLTQGLKNIDLQTNSIQVDDVNLHDKSCTTRDLPDSKLDIIRHKPKLAVDQSQKRKYKWAKAVDLINDADEISNFEEKLPNLGHSWPFTLDAFQKHAIVHISRGNSVLVAAHTSAGKTVVAEYAIALAKRNKTRVVYTSPIKALSNQKYRDFKQRFGDDIGLITGDIYLKANAFCLIMTTEILKVMLYTHDDLISELEWVIFDEVHYINDEERGVVWEEVCILLPSHVKMIFLSATAPNALEFADWIGSIKNRQIYVIYTTKRPVPLEHFLYISNLPDQKPKLIAKLPKKKKGGLNHVNNHFSKEIALKESNHNEINSSTGDIAVSGRTFLLVDSNNQFLGENYRDAKTKLQETFEKINKATLIRYDKSAAQNQPSSEKNNPQDQFKKHSNSKPAGNIAPKGGGKHGPKQITLTPSSQSSSPSLAPLRDKRVWIDFIKHCQTWNKLPAVVFIFSRKRIEHIVQMLLENSAADNLNLTTKGEKAKIEVFCRKCISKLNPLDQELPQVIYITRLLRTGIGVHHSGILPILKEMVEFLFHNSCVKVLFATETFAMGLNMPARTAAFELLRKFDGTGFRNLAPAEYIQMAGRAGRRGMDTTGAVYLLFKDCIMDEIDLKMIMLGKPAKLESKFYLNYGMILHLLQNANIKAEDMLRRSFAEFYHQANTGFRLEELKNVMERIQEPEPFLCKLCSTDIDLFYKTFCDFYNLQHSFMNKLFCYKRLFEILCIGRVIIFKLMHSDLLNMDMTNSKNPKQTEKALSPLLAKDSESKQKSNTAYTLCLGLILKTNRHLSVPHLKVIYIKPKNMCQRNLDLNAFLNEGTLNVGHLIGQGSSTGTVTNDAFKDLTASLNDYLTILVQTDQFIRSNFLPHIPPNSMNAKINNEYHDRIGILEIKNFQNIIYITHLNCQLYSDSILHQYRNLKTRSSLASQSMTGKFNTNNNNNPNCLTNQNQTDPNGDFNAFFHFVPPILERIKYDIASTTLNQDTNSLFIYGSDKAMGFRIKSKAPHNFGLNSRLDEIRTSILSPTDVKSTCSTGNSETKIIKVASHQWEIDLELEEMLKTLSAKIRLARDFRCVKSCPALTTTHFANFVAGMDYQTKKSKLSELAKSLMIKTTIIGDSTSNEGASLLEKAGGNISIADNYEDMQFLPEYQQRIKVLKELDYIDANLVTLMKGRVACAITNAEIVLTELLFWNYFENLEPEVIVAILSSIICQEKHLVTESKTPELFVHKENFLKIVSNIALVESKCGLNSQNFMDSFNFGMMEVVYQWAKGKSFKEITTLTNAQEGSIVRCIQRLEEICQNLRNAARLIGETNLYQKMEIASFKIKRDIVFAASLYTLD